MSIRLNIFTGMLDYVGMTADEAEAYLKLDQTTPQTVINGAPQFDEGLTIKKDKFLRFDGE